MNQLNKTEIEERLKDELVKFIRERENRLSLDAKKALIEVQEYLSNIVKLSIEGENIDREMEHVQAIIMNNAVNEVKAVNEEISKFIAQFMGILISGLLKGELNHD